MIHDFTDDPEGIANWVAVSALVYDLDVAAEVIEWMEDIYFPIRVHFITAGATPEAFKRRELPLIMGAHQWSFIFKSLADYMIFKLAWHDNKNFTIFQGRGESEFKLPTWLLRKYKVGKYAEDL